MLHKNNTKDASLNVLVTGGAGFIGSALVRYLINHSSYHVINLDKLTYAANLKSVEAVSDNPRYSFEQVDICDAAELKRVFNQHQPDWVFHLAAESHVDRSIESPAAFIQTNIVGTFTLLEQARAYLVEHPQKQATFRLVHVSTDEVYGDLAHPNDLNTPASLTDGNNNTPSPLMGEGWGEGENPAKFTETHAYKPSSPYSASKAASDHLIQAWWRTYQLPGILVHCSNNYGPFQYAEKLIPKTIINALNGQPIPIYGNGQQIRDWMFVEDTVKALITVVQKGQLGETYNIGTQTEKQNIEIVKTICEILDDLIPLPQWERREESEITSYAQLITHVKDRPGHDMHYAIDASKIQRELGWQPQETFESGILKTVQWYLNYQALPDANASPVAGFRRT